MLWPWFPAAMLALESSDVIRLRSLKIAAGGHGARRDIGLMVAEKVSACVEAAVNLCGGGTPAMTVNRYREHVAANALRLAP